MPTGFIYCIENIKNNKKYIGKTTNTVEKRFREHILDSRRRKNENRPLYRAINSYGAENFTVKELMSCDINDLDYYEKLFIEKFNTYKDGYNATLGGDGKILFDYQQILDLYNKGLYVKEISEAVGCCSDTIYTILHNNGINQIRTLHNTSILNPKQKVQMLDLNTDEVLMTFESVGDAARWLVENKFAKCNSGNLGGIKQKICHCYEGRQKTAYKHKWQKYKIEK